MGLQLELHCVDARVLVIGSVPALSDALAQLHTAAARVSRLENAEAEEPYARRHLTPRPLLIVLGTENRSLAKRVKADARERGILLIDVLNPHPESGSATLLPVQSV